MYLACFCSNCIISLFCSTCRYMYKRILLYWDWVKYIYIITCSKVLWAVDNFKIKSTFLSPVFMLSIFSYLLWLLPHDFSICVTFRDMCKPHFMWLFKCPGVSLGHRNVRFINYFKIFRMYMYLHASEIEMYCWFCFAVIKHLWESLNKLFIQLSVLLVVL